MKPLRPGDFYLVVKKNGGYLLRGIRLDGSPVRLPCATRGEAERLAEQLFRPATVVPLAQVDATQTTPAAATPELDDWGLPRVSPQTVASVAAAVGARPEAPAGLTPEELARKKLEEARSEEAKRQADEVQKKRRKYAATFSELLGSGWAMGVGMAARKTHDPDEWDIARPNPKHLSDLADCTAEGIQQSFGDREIGPWTMTFMLSIGIVVSVWFQSTRKKKPEGAKLQSVP